MTTIRISLKKTKKNRGVTSRVYKGYQSVLVGHQLEHLIFDCCISEAGVAFFRHATTYSMACFRL